MIDSFNDPTLPTQLKKYFNERSGVFKQPKLTLGQFPVYSDNQIINNNRNTQATLKDNCTDLKTQTTVNNTQNTFNNLQSQSNLISNLDSNQINPSANCNLMINEDDDL